MGSPGRSSEKEGTNKEEIKKKEVDMAVKQPSKQASMPVIQVRVGRRGSSDMTVIRHTRHNIKSFQEEVGVKGGKGKEEREVVQSVSRRRWSVDMMSSSGGVNTEKNLPLVRRSSQQLLAPLSQLSLQTDAAEEAEEEPMDDAKTEYKEENKGQADQENLLEKVNVLRDKVPSISRLQGIKKKVSQRTGQLTAAASASDEKADIGAGEKSVNGVNRDAKQTLENSSSLWTDSLSLRLHYIL